MQIGSSYSTLNATELLKQIVSQYKISEPVSCEFWVRGLNDTYKISTATDNFILRVYRKNWRTNADIAFELDALNHIHAQGGKVACPIERKHGGYMTTVSAPEGERQIIVTQYAKGTVPNYDDSTNTNMFGASVAGIHVQSSNFQTKHERYRLDLTHLLVEPLAAIKRRLSHHQRESQFIIDFASRLSDNVASLSAEKLDIGFCHGDFHGRNAHIYQNEVTHFDFDCCGLGWRIYDLATFKWHARKHRKEDQRWPAFLEGYQSVRTIPALDLSLLETFVAIREIWLMGLHLASVHTFGTGWLNDEYINQGVNFLKDAENKLDALSH